MKKIESTMKGLVIDNPSEKIVSFVNMLRDRKKSQQEKLRNKKEYSIKLSIE